MKTELVRQAWPRAVFHAGLGTIIAVLAYLLPWLASLIALVVATLVCFAIDLARLRSPAWNQKVGALFGPFMRRREASRLTGASYFLLGCLITVAAFPKDIAVLALMFLSLGDPAATIIGTWKGRVRHRGKSLEGDLACLFICLVIAFAAAGLLPGMGFVVAVCGAVFAALFQALSLPLNDNLTIPVGSGLVMMTIAVVMR